MSELRDVDEDPQDGGIMAEVSDNLDKHIVAETATFNPARMPLDLAASSADGHNFSYTEVWGHSDKMRKQKLESVAIEPDNESGKNIDEQATPNITPPTDLRCADGDGTSGTDTGSDEHTREDQSTAETTPVKAIGTGSIVYEATHVAHEGLTQSRRLSSGTVLITPLPLVEPRSNTPVTTGQSSPTLDSSTYSAALYASPETYAFHLKIGTVSPAVFLEALMDTAGDGGIDKA